MIQKTVKMMDILRDLEASSDVPKITLQEVIEKLETRGYGPLLIGPPLLTLLPTGAIPGMPAIVALLICLIAGQRLVGHKTVKLPHFLRKLSISRNKMRRLLVRSEPFFEVIDDLIHARLPFMFWPVTERLIAGISILMAVSMIPLGFIPFAVMVPSFALVMLGLGLSARDGALIIISFVSMLTLVFFIF